MALRLIRRHLKDCHSKSTRYRRCKCPIHVYGRLAGERIRKAQDQTSWDCTVTFGADQERRSFTWPFVAETATFTVVC